MSKALFALERRLEVRGLYVFFVCLLGLAAFGVLHGDWWLLAICFVASSLNGMIGQGLQKNRQKSFKQLAARSDLGEAQTADKPGSIDFHIVARSATRFMALIALVGAVVAYHFDEPLWRVIATGVIAWLVAALLILSIFYKAQTQTLDKSLGRGQAGGSGVPVLQGKVVGAEVWGAITAVAVMACWAAGKTKSHRRLASVYAFVVQLVGAYSVSFVVDMLRLSVAGELQLGAVVLPAFVWSGIAGAATIVAGTASSSPILLASPYALVALVAGLAGFIHVENLVTSLFVLAVGTVVFLLLRFVSDVIVPVFMLAGLIVIVGVLQFCGAEVGTYSLWMPFVYILLVAGTLTIPVFIGSFFAYRRHRKALGGDRRG